METMNKDNEEEIVALPFPEVQLLIEREARRLCYILSYRDPWSDIEDPEVREIVKSLEIIFKCLDNWRM
jgi:hypothetical protein